MPKFIYTAKSYTGETKGGEMDARDEKSLAQQLRNQGFLVTSLKQIEEKKTAKGVLAISFGSVPLKEKMIFARNLGVMIAAGVNITKAISNLSLQTKNKKFQTVLGEIRENLQEGKTLSEGLAKHPEIFNNLFINMVRVGETAGNLEEVLNIIAVQLEKDHDLIRKVKGAMTYPAVIVVAMLGIGVLMLTYILPQITGTFVDMEVTLPPTTMFIIGISDFLRNNSLVATLLLIFSVIFLKIFSKTAVGQKTLSYVAINFPLVKDLVVQVNCARFARIYSSLLKSGVSVVESLRIISETLTNHYYCSEIKKGIEQVQKGITMSQILADKGKIFPPLVIQMLEVGEETGKTEAVLLRLAEFYEAEVDQITKNLSSIIEPILMLLIGGAVGFFAVAMLQPMYSVLENIK